MRPILQILLFCLAALPAAAGTPGPIQEPMRATEEARARTAPLMDALGIDRLLAVIRQEGLAHAADIQSQMFPGRGGARWTEMAGDIYGVDRMKLLVLDEMAADTEPWHLDPLLDFFNSDLGKRIIALEISAREAMIDPSVEAAANEYLSLLRDEGARRLELLETFAEVNDLVDTNVAGALNASLAFYTGLNKAGAFGTSRGDRDMLRDVWRQEPQIRMETELWVMSYVALAYQPLSDDELQTYIDFSRTEAGQQMNTDLFEAFDELAQTISNELGAAAAQFMSGEDL